MPKFNYFKDIPNKPTTKAKLQYIMGLLGCDLEQLPYLMGQIEVESQGFTRMYESLYYTSAARIKAVFPRLKWSCTEYVRNAVKLGDALYGDYMHRGYGALQLTWGDAHSKYFASEGRPPRDYKSEGADAVGDFYRTAGYYFNMMKPKLAYQSTIEARATMYGRLINRGINSNKNLIPLHNEERIAATRNWISICKACFDHD